jgi:hypothetical protein
MITHNTSAIIVFQSMEYKNFRMITGNRGLNLGKINRIIKEIESGNDMLQYYPIQVKVTENKMDILDGQHRFFIAKKLKRPVHYILIAEQKTMGDIANVNSNVEKWTLKDFVNCYITQGNKHYIKLQQFVDIYGISIGISAKMLYSGNPGNEGTDKSLNEKFQKGLFEIKEWEAAVELAENCKKFSWFEHYTGRGFLIAIYRIAKAGLVSIDDLAEACAKHKDLLEKSVSYKQYVNNLETILNKGKQKRTVIL